MVEFDSKNEGVYQCKQFKLETAHCSLLSLQNWLVEVVNLTKIGSSVESTLFYWFFCYQHFTICDISLMLCDF